MGVSEPAEVPEVRAHDLPDDLELHESSVPKESPQTNGTDDRARNHQRGRP